MARSKSKTKRKGHSSLPAGTFEEAASAFYATLRNAKVRALQALESLERAVEQELAMPQVRERMTGIDQEFGRLTKASRRELASLVKVAERDLGSVATTVRGLSTALASALTGKPSARKRASRTKKTAAKAGKRSTKARKKAT